MINENNAIIEPVTVVFSWKVDQQHIKEFMDVMHELHKVARSYPGHMGISTISSPSQKGSYQSVLRFDTAENLEKWLTSPERKKMIEPLLKYARIDTTSHATGLETWFELPGQSVIPPPKWKMSLVTIVAIYPISLLFSLYLTPILLPIPPLLRSFILPIVAVPMLTYILIPFLTQKVFRHWLYKTT